MAKSKLNKASNDQSKAAQIYAEVLDPELMVEPKQRSKSSICLNRDSYGNTEVILSSERVQIDIDKDLESGKFQRHSFPGSLTDSETASSDSSQKQSKDESSGAKKNDKEKNAVTDSTCKPNEFYVLNNGEVRIRTIFLKKLLYYSSCRFLRFSFFVFLISRKNNNTIWAYMKDLFFCIA